MLATTSSPASCEQTRIMPPPPVGDACWEWGMGADTHVESVVGSNMRVLDSHASRRMRVCDSHACLRLACESAHDRRRHAPRQDSSRGMARICRRVAKTRSMLHHTLIHAERGEGGAVKGVGELGELGESCEGGSGLRPDAMGALAARPLERVQRRRSLRALEPLHPHLLLTMQSERLLQSHHLHPSPLPASPQTITTTYM